MIKLGKKYLTRNNQIAEVVSQELEDVFIANIDNKEYYVMDTGHIFDPFGYNPPENELDLIKEYDL